MNYQKDHGRKKYYIVYLFPALILLFPSMVVLPSVIKYIIIITYFISLILVVYQHFNDYSTGRGLLIIAILFTLFLCYLIGYRGSNYIPAVYLRLLFWTMMISATYMAKINISTILMQRCLNIILIMMTITTVTTILGLIRYPLASRALATGFQTPNTLMYNSLNIGGYSFVYAISFLSSSLALLIRRCKNKNKKMVYVAVYCVILICVVLSQYTFAIILVGASLIPLIFANKKVRVGWFILGSSIALLLLLVFKNQILAGIYSLGKTLINQNLNEVGLRLCDAVNEVRGFATHGDANIRQDLYQKSFALFIDSPLIGQIGLSSPQMGGHSEILDTLALGGIFLFIGPFLLFLSYLSAMKKTYIKQDCYSWLILFFFEFVVFACINTVLIAPEIVIAVFIVPNLIIKLDLVGSEERIA